MVTEADLARAVALLRAGELVAFPTETVYGLGADAQNPAAVAKIFAAKGRPADHPLIVHLAGVAALEHWARDIPPQAYALANAFWPGPLTLILKRSAIVPDAVTGGQDTVGLRVPAHPVAQRLLAAFGGGLAAPSANRFGRISPTTAQHVIDELNGAVPLVLDGGACDVGIESTILDLSSGSPVLLRPGAIRAEQIKSVIGESPRLPHRAVPVPRASGTLAAHYAPGTPMALVATDDLADRLAALLAASKRVGVFAPTLPAEVAADARVLFVPAPTHPDAYAQQLYDRLRHLDAAGMDWLLVEAPPRDAGWDAVRDRLTRSAAGAGCSAP